MIAIKNDSRDTDRDPHDETDRSNPVPESSGGLAGVYILSLLNSLGGLLLCLGIGGGTLFRFFIGIMLTLSSVIVVLEVSDHLATCRERDLDVEDEED